MRQRETILAILLILIAASLLAPWSAYRARERGLARYTACASNLKDIGTALEIYATGPAGRFPQTLSLLAPNDIKRIPTCPAVGEDTYSRGFSSASTPDAYTIVCRGDNHSDMPCNPNFPQYTSTEGLRPENPYVERQIALDNKYLEDLRAPAELHCKGQSRAHVLDFCRQHGIQVYARREDSSFHLMGYGGPDSRRVHYDFYFSTSDTRCWWVEVSYAPSANAQP